MRNHSFLPLSLLSAAVVLCCSLVAAGQQTRDKFVISAKAGGINAITGGATVNSRGKSAWEQLMITDDLDAGDRVRTAHDGRVEILLNPGSYLRLGGNSEVELLDNTLANLEVKLLRGTAIVEATGADGLELNIGISTPHTRVAIVRQGLYRLNVVPEDATELIVRKGRVILSDQHTKVKGGNKVIFSATNVFVAKLTKEEKKKLEQQDVDVWSKERAETLAKANRRINNRMLTSAFASVRDPFWFTRGSGLWFFNSRLGCYTFLPFYYGWGSPYGSSYTTSVYVPYVPNRTYPNSSGSSNYPPTSGSNGSGGSGSSGGSRSYPPPQGGYRPPPGNGPGGGVSREPRMTNPETGRPTPRKNLDKIPGQP